VEENFDSTNDSVDVSVITGNSYIYYYGEWCPHCTEVDTYLTETDGYNKLNIVKKEIWYNEANASEMSESLIRLWLNPNDIWIPFIIVKNWENETYLWGDKTIIEYFKPYLWEANSSDSEINSDGKNRARTIVLIIIVILAVIIPTTLIKMTNNN
jgi:hypothetical protein